MCFISYLEISNIPVANLSLLSIYRSSGKVEPASYDLPSNNTSNNSSRSNEVKGRTGHSYHSSDIEDKMMQILSNSKLGAGGEWVVAAPRKDTDVHAGTFR